ncbi:MAG TPA: hypothetical protein VHQ98_02995 [Gaiellaceae bacterium]|nr:hypothetical protein [Gaiellaceae bacterium]
MSLSPRVRILAAALFVAVLALAAGFLLLGRGQGSSQAAVKTIKPLHPGKKAATTRATTLKAVKPTKTVARKPVAKRTTHVRPAVVDGMPAALAAALASHKVVVVSLYAPRSSVDEMATAEAKHGAALAGAGFVAFSVANERIVSPLSSLLTGAPTAADRVLDGPAVLVFQRPRTLFVRLNGFADRDTVAQAAANADTLAG